MEWGDLIPVEASDPIISIHQIEMSALKASISRRSTVQVQAAKTVKAVKKTADSGWYGPDRPLFLGAFSEFYCALLAVMRKRVVPELC